MCSGKSPFKGRQFTAAVILWAVRWYLQFPICYRDLERMLADRGVAVDHTTLYRWIQAYAPGRRLVRPKGPKAERAKQEIDYGRRDVAGYVFGAFRPATGDVLTATYEGRTTANWIDFLGRVEAWIGPAVERVHAVLDNLNCHSGPDVLLFNLAHPRWEFVFQPKYAAYLNLIEPWWKVLRSLALKGRRFDAWAEIEAAVERATAYWNMHKHPFVWDRRRRHRAPSRLGVAALPNA